MDAGDDAPDVSMSGFLALQVPKFGGLMSSWKHYWCVLTGFDLALYAKKDDANPARSTDMSEAWATGVGEDPAKNKFFFNVGAGSHSYSFYAPSEAERKQWLDAIAKVGLKTLKVIIAGAPASGKGTQCELISDELGLVHLSTGDMLRAAVKAKSKLGVKAKEYMDAGNLVPDDLIINLVKNRLAQPDCMKHGWLLDGFPRTEAQGLALVEAGIEPTKFVLLECPEDLLIKRVVGRRLDPVTGKLYHVEFTPPPNEVIAARLIQRSDDTEEKARVRLATYNDNLAAIVGLYENILRRFDSARNKQKVFAEVRDFLTAADNNKK